eukprot:6179492-Pleurochrysis_carterae.AAC.1
MSDCRLRAPSIRMPLRISVSLSPVVTSAFPPASRGTAAAVGSSARIASAARRSCPLGSAVWLECDMPSRRPLCRRWSCACPARGCRTSR